MYVVTLVVLFILILYSFFFVHFAKLCESKHDANLDLNHEIETLKSMYLDAVLV